MLQVIEELPILVASSHCARRLLTELENPDNLTISPKLCGRKGNHVLITLNLKISRKRGGCRWRNNNK